MSTTTHSILHELSRRLDLRQITLAPVRTIDMLALAWRVRRERNQLAGLDARTLKDIGVYPRDAEIEARRGLTDLPKARLPRD